MPVIKVTGVKETRKALRAFAPDLNKALNSELRKALSPVVKQARGFVPSDSPMGGWAPRAMSENNGRFPFYDASVIKRGIGFSTSPGKPTRSGFVSNASIFNNSQVGQIYEAAGRRNQDGQPWVGPKSRTASKKYSTSVNEHAGEQFIKNLPDLTSSLMGTGRLIYRAWAQNKGVAYGAAMKAIDKAERAFMARTKTETLSKAA